MELNWENMDAIDGHYVEILFKSGLHYDRIFAFIPDPLDSDDEEVYVDFRVPDFDMILPEPFEEIEWFKVLD